MIVLEETVTPSKEQWKAIVRGTRNPLNSWDKSDSLFYGEDQLGPEDYKLMMKLRNAGSDHRKFMRMITVYVDITAPLYWWKEFDTYKIGTVRNSCSTMHKIHAKEFTIDDFSHEHLSNESISRLEGIIDILNESRYIYNNGRGVISPHDKDIWWQMIQLLPDSYNQKATVMLNYETLLNIYSSRKYHKLNEWRRFCSWIKSLPYSELITGEYSTLAFATKSTLADAAAECFKLGC